MPEGCIRGSLNDITIGFDRAEEAILTIEISDESLEAAAGTEGRFLQTLESSAANCCRLDWQDRASTEGAGRAKICLSQDAASSDNVREIECQFLHVNAVASHLVIVFSSPFVPRAITF